ncbi:MAG: 50S ribosomal protein L24 [bacterium]|nr:50S ribosomal protein L24 [bacterium]
MKIRKGDKVLIIAGKNRNQVGTVELVLVKKGKAIVAGLNMVKKHLKRSAKNPQGGIIDQAMPIQISNLMIIDPSSDKPSRIGYVSEGKKKIRVAKLSNRDLSLKKE